MEDTNANPDLGDATMTTTRSKRNEKMLARSAFLATCRTFYGAKGHAQAVEMLNAGVKLDVARKAMRGQYGF